MKVVLVLVALIQGVDGNDRLLQVGDKEYTSVLKCHAEKAHHKQNPPNIIFMCINKDRLK